VSGEKKRKGIWRSREKNKEADAEILARRPSLKDLGMAPFQGEGGGSEKDSLTRNREFVSLFQTWG